MKTKEEIYLTNIHKWLDKQELIDLHTYFLEMSDMEVCPICNEWLVKRTKPHITR